MAMPEEALEPMNEEEFSQVFQIMTASFPKDERRDEQGQRRLLQEKEYEILVCRQEGRVVAFFAVWNMEPMLYIEHFAVTQEKRGSGLGRKTAARTLLTGQKACYIGSGTAGNRYSEKKNRFL